MLTRIDLTVDVPREGTVDAAAVVRVVGTADASDAGDLAARLTTVLREHERVVADVSGLDSDDETVARALPVAMESAGGWPLARLVLAAPRPALHAVLAAGGFDRRVLVCPDVPTAEGHLDLRPPEVQAFWEFEVTPTAAGTARNHVRAVCAAWEVDDEVRESLEIVVTELVTNAVEHAGSASRVDVERSASTFRLAVRDWETSVLPAAVLPPATAPRGRGLAMVAAVSRDWGVRTHADGKTVWAEMATG